MEVGTLKTDLYICFKSGEHAAIKPLSHHQGKTDFFMTTEIFEIARDIYYQEVVYSPEDIETALQEIEE